MAFKLFEKIVLNKYFFEEECGPQTWSKDNSKFGGKYQSPINIETSEAVFDKRLAHHKLQIKYDSESCDSIKNTGHTFQINSIPNNHSIVSGGPLKSKFQFLQFHMHWGDCIEIGSEHLVDSEAFSAELHFVNWNFEKYQTAEEAVKSDENDGLVVLSQFVQIGEEEHSEFEKVSNCLDEIHLKDESAKIENINLRNLLNDDLSEYWTYPGSLTTPDYNESVRWIVFKNPIYITAQQLERCHHLYEVTKEKLCNEHTIIRYNDRSVCSIGSRTVLKSFDY